MRIMHVKSDMSIRLLLCALIASFACTAQSPVPDTPAGHQFSAWLVAFNSGDHAALRQFLEKNFLSRVANIGQEFNFRDQTGGFDFKKTEESTPTRFVALVKERTSDTFARAEMEVEAGEPHQITRFGLRAVPRPSEFPSPRLSEKELVAALKMKLEQDAAADRFAGAVLLAKYRNPVFSPA